MIAVGVDPGSKCGVAVVRGQRLLAAHTIDGDDLPTIVGLVQQVRDMENAVVVIELQHAGRGKAVNPKSLATLMRRRHNWEVICELYEVKVVQVWPASWQSQLKITARFGPKGGKRSTKDRSMEAAQFYFGEKVGDHEQADASLIARWYLQTPEARA